MGFVIETEGSGTPLGVLDVRNIAADPVVTVRLPHLKPPAIYGAWLPAP